MSPIQTQTMAKHHPALGQEEKLRRVTTLLEDLLMLINLGVAVKFTDLTKKHNLSWNVGCRSILFILRKKLKVVMAGKGHNIYKLTMVYDEKYKSKGIEFFAKVVLRYIEKWEGRNSKPVRKIKRGPYKKSKSESYPTDTNSKPTSADIDYSQRISKEVQASTNQIPTGNFILQLDEMEQVGLHQFLRTALMANLSPALKLVGQQILSKISRPVSVATPSVKTVQIKTLPIKVKPKQNIIDLELDKLFSKEVNNYDPAWSWKTKARYFLARSANPLSVAEVVHRIMEMEPKRTHRELYISIGATLGSKANAKTFKKDRSDIRKVLYSLK